MALEKAKLNSVLIIASTPAIEFVSQYGYWGIFLLSLSGGVYQPIGPDIFIISRGFLGLNPYLSAGTAIVGTLLGALIGYGIGLGLQKTLLKRLIQRWQKQFDKAQHYIDKYGTWGVAIAAFGPIPLTQVAWVVGISRMPLKKFIPAVLLGLIPRFVGEAIFGNYLCRLLNIG